MEKENVEGPPQNELDEAKNALISRRKALKKAGKAGLYGLGAYVFMGLGIPNTGSEAQAACWCSGCTGCTGCTGTCTGGCFWGCTGGCRGICEGCTAACKNSCSGCTGSCKGVCMECDHAVGRGAATSSLTDLDRKTKNDSQYA